MAVFLDGAGIGSEICAFCAKHGTRSFVFHSDGREINGSTQQASYLVMSSWSGSCPFLDPFFGIHG